MIGDAFAVFEEWLTYLDSHDGRLTRVRRNNALATEYDLLTTIPAPPGGTIFTVGDLRALVEAGREWRRLKGKASGVKRQRAARRKDAPPS